MGPVRRNTALDLAATVRIRTPVGKGTGGELSLGRWSAESVVATSPINDPIPQRCER
jgi:hypothetical protein